MYALNLRPHFSNWEVGFLLLGYPVDICKIGKTLIFSMYRYFRDIWFLSKLGQFWKRSNSLLIHFTSGSFLNFPFDLSTNYPILLKIYSNAGPIGNRIWPIITQCGIHLLLLNIPFCTWPEACFIGEIEMGVTSHISFFWFNLHLSFFLFKSLEKKGLPYGTRRI